ncbi:sphingomyelin phosphodiesterase 5-like [Branchiostoma floridae]|uniref:sphingomyelin phosphodiesterase n=1 Tax=Branchiostoma floridae TaxID=7739 RepID=A0A9J7LMB0_BRAFL|nr:sphingomyelin phosphodiesterase 5-like [Branchiostoma floridae]
MMIKIHLGTSHGRDVMGYVATTHLQAYQGTRPVQTTQLTLMQTWLQEFRLSTKTGNETVAVDVVCGDFNFDNMSPGYKSSWTHPFMDVYQDVCSLQKGRDKPWTIGTEMRQVVLYDEAISTHGRMAATLRQRHLQGRYLLDATVRNPTMDMVWEEEKAVRHDEDDVPETSGRVRVDKVLYRTDALGGGCTVTPVRYRSVTHFAGLTDHVSVCLTFRMGRK